MLKVGVPPLPGSVASSSTRKTRGEVEIIQIVGWEAGGTDVVEEVEEGC